MSAEAMPAVAGLSALAPRYDVLLCDVWGVVHDGVAAYPGANDALPRFRAAGGTVVLVSNAPIPSASVARLLDQKGVARQAWDRIVTSGDVTRAVLTHRGIARLHHIGPERDLALFRDLRVARVAPEDAEIAVATGLLDDERETGETYRPLLARLVARRLDLVCANPDRVVEVGGRLLPCAGAIADVHASLGGRVVWAGKPYPAIYEAARRAAGEARGAPVEDARILCVGDSVVTDLAGAADAGLDALFVTGGIHREALAPDGTLDTDALTRLLDGHRAPVGIVAGLAW